MEPQYVALFNSCQVGLIVAAETGIVWRTWVGEEDPVQVGSWQERALEGIYVPLSNDAPEGWPTLEERLQSVWAGSNVFELNEVLAEVSSSDVISLDAEGFAGAVPGWLPVRVEPQGEFSLLEGMSPSVGVLVWPFRYW
ncbi:DUF6210 family protein [Pseudomaricurvus sp. HS19]|uniref:DUF6210 family protein n=1 Tax=Pseudomaricurvus sp. HS19 TaxID=2692626 RepID=UPI00136EC956|nr:DUF6210 family protein [Pseudomaricurvus sp. HS19]MYM62704.1 hypothetical protein [Pseudomaricurvus sp. HS19]